jgi:hypothetical protein
LAWITSISGNQRRKEASVSIERFGAGRSMAFAGLPPAQNAARKISRAAFCLNFRKN